VSNHRENLELTAEVDTVREACERAVAPLEFRSPWHRKTDSFMAQVVEDRPMVSAVFTGTYPAKVDITIVPLGSSARVELNGKNFAFGPSQSRHIKRVVQSLAMRIELEMLRESNSVVPSSATEQSPGQLRPNSVFISYRRDDTQFAADHIGDRLKMYFGSDSIYLDVDKNRGGTNFVNTLTSAVQNCSVLVVVIDPRWVGGTDGTPRRLDDPDDWVRFELETAIERGIPIVPILIRGAIVPRKEELPVSLRPIVDFQAQTVGAGRAFDRDMELLQQDIEELLKPR